MHIHLLQTVSLRQLQQAINVGVVAVHAAIGNQSVQVQGRSFRFAVVYRIHQGRIFEESTILNLFGNSGQFLIHNAPCAHVKMSYL